MEQVQSQDNSIKLFGRFSYDDIIVNDLSLKPYINVQTRVSVPHTGSNCSQKAFSKAGMPITMRLAHGLMRHGRNTGKSLLVLKAIKDAFIIIERLTKKNPLQILVDACINGGPREHTARIGKGGSAKRSSVDVSPLRRLNLSISTLTTGMRRAAFKGAKTLPETIAEELIAAARENPNSFAVKKRDEIERVAKSSR
ncbi:small subunit ribosomal protein S5e [Nematocida homosporus]|uniref:small subunit ribosomal protein S5e n=1 Tax=Nematocida homosporus TaxID=1912981 RepID=UPI002220A0C8|nr:small subunit ribosomal protein S5e [Nematocida homosporus]KAI5186795.1 small subunit ribosomal protein S5e [Nematocida homosporus]